MGPKMLVEIPHQATGLHRHHTSGWVQVLHLPQCPAEHDDSPLQRDGLAVVAGA